MTDKNDYRDVADSIQQRVDGFEVDYLQEGTPTHGAFSQRSQAHSSWSYMFSFRAERLEQCV